jgi:pilus assembly protein CpaF
MKDVREFLAQKRNINRTLKAAQNTTAPEAGGARNRSLAAGWLSSASSHGKGTSESEEYNRMKARIHERLLTQIDVKAVLRIQDEKVITDVIERAVELLIEEQRLPLSLQEKMLLSGDVIDEILGLGPLEPLLADSAVNDILVNGYDSVWIDRNGQLQSTDIKFRDEQHVLHVINRIVSRVGRRIDESSPMVDARLPDGSRVNAIIRPLSRSGPVVSIRRFRPTAFDLDELVSGGSLSEQMAEFLRLAVMARTNILVSGGTSAGKTTLLNVLSCHIQAGERIITIEDTAELQLQQPHVLSLETRPPNSEGKGAVTQHDLVRNSLRMRPDRIIVGEVRGPEALDMLQAMNTGHDGALTTVHANSPRDAVSRLETLVLLSGIDLSQRSIREQIAAAFDLIVQAKRLADGSRKVVSIVEVSGITDSTILMQTLYQYEQTHISATSGKVHGRHTACGIRPLVLQKFEDAGLSLPTDLFRPQEPAR